jgi:hypothetical protein
MHHLPTGFLRTFATTARTSAEHWSGLNAAYLSPNMGFILQPRVAKLPWVIVENGPCPEGAAS